MTDILLHLLPFGGAAFEPVSPAGEAWLNDYCQHRDSLFTNEDACMTGFPDSAVGFEPLAASYALDDAFDADLVVRPA